ncbi:Tyrosine kinase receptor Cad96Ca [Oopsacas minuta]|uniref:Tyrosine kinase receptor Cad96Ca n=1 Tax=Oopsacas minuta TaxID=111878 RepID=A0AAV7KB90_9METZ|nr:Tyrosine kinase receptor Cad96Ca [Oopsacas minuta]
MSGMTINGFPMFNSTGLTNVDISGLKLPSLITIDSSMLNLPQLTFLRLTSNIEWYKFAENAFENAISIERIELIGSGLQEFPRNLLANITTLRTLRVWNSDTIDFLLNYTFPKLEILEVRYDELQTLDQKFFEKQKSLNNLDARNNPFNCDCDISWTNHVTDNLGWTILGTCTNGNSISDSSNYLNCNQSSFNCFTVTCSSDSVCVNTVNSSFCECVEAGYLFENDTCVDMDECSNSADNNCDQVCTNTNGSYTCSCNIGFTLDSDMSTCSGVNKLASEGILLLFLLLSFLVWQLL